MIDRGRTSSEQRRLMLMHKGKLRKAKQAAYEVRYDSTVYIAELRESIKELKKYIEELSEF